MKLLIQRVSSASVEVDREIVSSIKQGILAFVGFDKHDSVENLEAMAEKLLNFKTFNDEKGKISKSLNEKGESNDPEETEERFNLFFKELVWYARALKLSRKV